MSTPRSMTIVLATKNPGKMAELRTLFGDLPVELLTIGEVLPSFVPPPEDGSTFAANALIKARAVAEATQLVAIADDSGLEVDALAGRPGVRSARFAHDNATDAENNAALLTALSEVDDAGRTARFRCVMALVDPFKSLDEPIYSEGRCEGSIARSAQGESGFGYDPLFLVTGLGRTYAELSEGDKNRISHRGKAAAELVGHVRRLVEGYQVEALRVLGASLDAGGGSSA